MPIGAILLRQGDSSPDQRETRYRNIKTCTPTATSEAAIASTPSIKPTLPSDSAWGVMVTAGLEEVELGPPGFLCKATDAWGRPDLLPAALGGTFAVSFLLSPESGAIGGTPATDGDLGPGATEAEGITGALGASGGGAAKEGGFGTPGGTPTTEGGLGAAGATPGIDGGFGAAGGVDKPPGAFGAIPGGFGMGMADGSPSGTETDSGTPGFWMGLGGRLIIAVSRGLDASG
ncbi:MAG: hypothetical protein WBL40_15730 [Terrimicrobiaceae bacterium]